MANEFKHKSAGQQLTSVEDDNVDRHVFNSQATGDIMIATSATQLSRLAKGTAYYVLAMGASNLPEWSSLLVLTPNAPTINAGNGSFQVNTTGAKGLIVSSTIAAATGVYLRTEQHSATPDDEDAILLIDVWGHDNDLDDYNYAQLSFNIEDITDEAEKGKIEWWLRAPAWNMAMTLSSAGTVGGDLAYAEFDRWDDKAIVQQLGIPVALREKAIAEKFAEMGITSKIEGHTASGGYMLNFQKGFWFNFHALKVAYKEIDILRGRIVILERSKN